MNIREPVEEENKKNNDSLTVPYYPANRSACQRKNQQKKNKKNKNKNKKEKKKKHTDRTQTKLNAPRDRYNEKTLPQ